MTAGPGMTAPKAVLLDAGGVLLLPNPWIIAATLRAAGGSLDPAQAHRLHYAAVAAMDAVRQRDWRVYNGVFVEAAGVPDDRREDAMAALRALYTAPAAGLWNVVPDHAFAHVAALADSGVAVAVVSNADGTVESLLRRCEYAFDVVIDSSVVGFEKPQREIFGVALDRLGVAPEDAVHVGDIAWADVDGALAAGVRPLHMDPFGDCRDAPGHHDHVRSLADVVALVGGPPIA